MVAGLTTPDRSALSAIPWTDVLVTPIGAAAAIGLTMAIVLAPVAIYLASRED
jgi:hypothetical protein